MASGLLHSPLYSEQNQRTRRIEWCKASGDHDVGDHCGQRGQGYKAGAIANKASALLVDSAGDMDGALERPASIPIGVELHCDCR